MLTVIKFLIIFNICLHKTKANNNPYRIIFPDDRNYIPVDQNNGINRRNLPLDGNAGISRINLPLNENNDNRTRTGALSLLPRPKTCGPIRPVEKIYGGTEAELGEFPWLVNLEYRMGMCGIK